MKRWVLLAAACWACAAGTQTASEPPPTSEQPPAAPEPVPASTEPSPEPAPSQAERDASVALPPLSTPNARPEAGADAGATAPAPESNYEGADARTRALAAGGRAAQRCHEQHAAGAAGKLALRITLAPSGKPARVEVDRSASTPALLGGKFETCVIAAFEKQTFPAPRAGADVLWEVPLQFQPPATAP